MTLCVCLSNCLSVCHDAFDFSACVKIGPKNEQATIKCCFSVISLSLSLSISLPLPLFPSLFSPSLSLSLSISLPPYLPPSAFQPTAPTYPINHHTNPLLLTLQERPPQGQGLADSARPGRGTEGVPAGGQPPGEGL